jgi:hypothetical protein
VVQAMAEVSSSSDSGSPLGAEAAQVA